MPHKDPLTLKEYKRLWRLKPENLAKEQSKEYKERHRNNARVRRCKLKEDPEAYNAALEAKRKYNATPTAKRLRSLARATYYRRGKRSERHPLAKAIKGLSKKGNCPYCGNFVNADAKEGEDGFCHIDHIVPRSRGGTSNTENLQFICVRCNFAKKDLTHEEFINDIISRYNHITRMEKP